MHTWGAREVLSRTSGLGCPPPFEPMSLLLSFYRVATMRPQPLKVLGESKLACNERGPHEKKCQEMAWVVGFISLLLPITIARDHYCSSSRLSLIATAPNRHGFETLLLLITIAPRGGTGGAHSVGGRRPGSQGVRPAPPPTAMPDQQAHPARGAKKRGGADRTRKEL